MMPMKIRDVSSQKDLSVGKAYMGDHVRQAASPVRNTEIGITEPAIAVREGTAPFTFGHVVVKMHVNALVVAFGCNSVEDLRPEFSALVFSSNEKEKSNL
jgi:hypothetical protein